MKAIVDAFNWVRVLFRVRNDKVSLTVPDRVPLSPVVLEDAPIVVQAAPLWFDGLVDITGMESD